MESTGNLSAAIQRVMQQSATAFSSYRQVSSDRRASFLLRIADEILSLGDELILTAAAETNLTPVRLTNERGRTILQLKQMAEMLQQNKWQEVIRHIPPAEQPSAHPDIRRMLFPLGPVVVFGSSNFPFAYSTAGGDTASALAAGCSVVVKAHPAHLSTSCKVAAAIQRAIEATNMPTHVFQHVEEGSFEAGKLLVENPHTAAVGFTGSFSGGKALWDYAAARPSPIPVFAEMGSVNPVLIFPDYLRLNTGHLADIYAGSITLGVGQFCTNPGLLIVSEGEGLDTFIDLLAQKMAAVAPAPMLHRGIAAAYAAKSSQALSVNGVTLVASSAADSGQGMAQPMLAKVSAEIFLQQPVLREEVFGPYSLVVVSRNPAQMMQVLAAVHGQLTVSLMVTEKDWNEQGALLETAIQTAGRIICNGVPTGVEVCEAMVHGGPFPATTDSRFTAVGIQSVRRWLRPVAFQNFPEKWLPEDLKV